MKRRALLRHLREHGCTLLREGTRHSIYHCLRTGLSASVPRHRELGDLLCDEICTQLGVQRVRRKPRGDGASGS